MNAEAFGADGTLVNRLTFNVSDHLAQLVLIWTVDKHVRFNVINRGYDFFRRQTYQTLNDVLDVLIPSLHLFQADFVGALDNCLRIVEPTPGYANVVVDMLKSRCWRLLKVHHRTCRCKLCHQLLYFLKHFCSGPPLFNRALTPLFDLMPRCHVSQCPPLRWSRVVQSRYVQPCYLVTCCQVLWCLFSRFQRPWK